MFSTPSPPRIIPMPCGIPRKTPGSSHGPFPGSHSRSPLMNSHSMFVSACFFFPFVCLDVSSFFPQPWFFPYTLPFLAQVFNQSRLKPLLIFGFCVPLPPSPEEIFLSPSSPDGLLPPLGRFSFFQMVAPSTMYSLVCPLFFPPRPKSFLPFLVTLFSGCYFSLHSSTSSPPTLFNVWLPVPSVLGSYLSRLPPPTRSQRFGASSPSFGVSSFPRPPPFGVKSIFVVTFLFPSSDGSSVTV